MKLLLIRHAESHGNATGEYATEQADSLSPKGLGQAERLGSSTFLEGCDRILVSPLLRTLQTIAPFLNKHGRKGEIWPEMAEACWHEEREVPTIDWVSRPAEVSPELKPFFEFRNQKALRPDHPETFGMGLRRVTSVLERLESEEPARSERTLLVTHGHFIREILNLMLQPGTLQEYHHDNCGLTQISFGAGGWELDWLNRKPLEE